MSRSLAECIALLPRPLRDVILLADVVGYDPHEAAASLKIGLVEFVARRRLAHCQLAAMLEDTDEGG
jgi:DNA-directed RNA polymerase specialized sigma24 family protein